MKKLFIILLVGLVGMQLKAQNATVALSDALTGKYIPIFGAASDTLTASAAKTYKVLVTAPFNLDLACEVRSTKVSGSPAFTAKIEESVTDSAYYAISGLQDVVKSGGTSFDLLWKSATDTATVTGRLFKITVTATSATQKSKLSGGCKIIKKQPAKLN